MLFGAIVFLVICASILAVSALHTLMRHGEATRVTSLFYLTPVFAVVLEFALFQVVPTWMSVFGIAITCAGVALVAWRDTAEVPHVRAHALHSQVAMHAEYGGVVPELASRDHIRRVLPLSRLVLEESGASLADIDYVDLRFDDRIYVRPTKAEKSRAILQRKGR